MANPSSPHLCLRAPLIALAMAAFVGATAKAQMTSEDSDPNKIAIEPGDGKEAVSYDLETIKRDFPISERVTRTPWTKEGQMIKFRGVFISDLLAKNGVSDYSAIEVHADDGFLARVPKEDIDNYEPMIAYERECTAADRSSGLCDADDAFRQIDIEESGPYFVVWPYSDLPSSYIPARNNLWVWWVISLRPVK
jgi:hypothetical protein